MSNPDIKFDNGAAYERMMGVWSQMVGAEFLNWLQPEAGLRWLDVGCGNGAFTELITQCCKPAEVSGLDSSQEQIDYAVSRASSRMTCFWTADAMALPMKAERFDAVTMALVIFFLPEPAKGVAEMARVTAPGGSVSAYAWDIIGGGSPIEPIRAEMRALGLTPAHAPADDASRCETLRDLWLEAGLIEVETQRIEVERSFRNFEDFWTTTLEGTILGPGVARLAEADRQRLKEAVMARLNAKDGGEVRYRAKANAVKGIKPV